MRFHCPSIVGFVGVTLVAATSQSAIYLQYALSAVQPTITAGGVNLVAYDLRAISNSGQIIRAVGNVNTTPLGAGAGLHQVWAPVVDGPTPTRAEHFPPLWSETWRQYDSYLFLDAASVPENPFSETNNHIGGAALPSAGFGAPNTGFGGISTELGGSRPVISGTADSDVTIAQFVLKPGEGVLVDVSVYDKTFTRTDFADVCVGLCPGLAPVAEDFVIPQSAGYNANGPGEPQTISHQFVALDLGVPSFILGSLNYQAAYGGTGPGPAVLPTLSNTGLFNWVTEGSPRGIYTWQYTEVVNNDPFQTDTGTIEIHVTGVPEPSAVSLLGLAMVGALPLFRRR